MDGMTHLKILIIAKLLSEVMQNTDTLGAAIGKLQPFEEKQNNKTMKKLAYILADIMELDHEIHGYVQNMLTEEQKEQMQKNMH